MTRVQIVIVALSAAFIGAMFTTYTITPDIRDYAKDIAMYDIHDRLQEHQDTTDALSPTKDFSATLEANPTRTTLEQKTNAGQIISSNKQVRKNVLFIIVDDLRPQLGAYFDPEHPDYFSQLKIHTPNLDNLASQSIVFKHNYAQYSLCGPSRTSLLTGRRPDVTRVFGNHWYWRDVGGNFTTLPQYFKDNGYLTIGLGKVFHPGASSNNDDPPSWTEPYHQVPYTDKYFLSNGSIGGWNSVSQKDVKDIPLADMMSTVTAKKILSNISVKAKTGEQPFFMALGYNKPHLHFICPEEYFYLYPLEDKDNFVPNVTWQKPNIRQQVRIDGIEMSDEKRFLPPDVLRKLRRAYFACISYMDHLVGEVLQHLDELGLADNTIVSFMADHGYHLGENEHWGKITTFEFANRVPLIIRIPGITDSGMTSSSIVESLDVFPTLVEAAGLDPVPNCPRNSFDISLCVQGTSLMPLIIEPNNNSKDVAISQIVDGRGMYYAIRKRVFRFVDYAYLKATDAADGKRITSLEWCANMECAKLFDHRNDILEQVNVVNETNYKDTVNKLQYQLHKFVEDQFR
ncbi:hypothetical protein LSH36_4g05020 [Paralvinella palmiformis]|uniref:Sulfatase N-terminal domain-containing protein n=1 Tax=Paralvinella palmiformis TaxID=53620 RepID=A0AAD9NH50_9ANNE|nr:hypothetical protein LSH36_4g05020 [Paralvinella palmiformis]